MESDVHSASTLRQRPSHCFTGIGLPFWLLASCSSARPVCPVNVTQQPIRGNSLISLKVFGFPGKISAKTKAKTKRIMPLGGNNGGSVWSNKNHSDLPCGISFFAPGRERCPDECAFQSLDPQKGCYWRCLEREQCGEDDPMQSFADDEFHLCRNCDVVGCAQCAPGEDRCKECKAGYEIVDGICKGRLRHIWKVAYMVIGVILGLVSLWYLSVLFGPSANPVILRQAMVHRWRALMRDRRGGGEAWYPLISNLGRLPSGINVPIGGPGLMLLFSFQTSIILWIVVLLGGWLIAGGVMGSEAFFVGTYLASSDQEMCQAVRWGRAVRDKLRLGKLVFTALLYCTSTVGAVAFAVVQYRRFSAADQRTSTMMDYAALCTGFPRERGPKVESDIEAFLAEVTGCPLVGVSVCWDFGAVKSQVVDLISNEVRRREAMCLNEPPPPSLSSMSRYALRAPDNVTARAHLAWRISCLFEPASKTIDWLLGLSEPPVQAGCADEDRVASLELLKDIASTGAVFAVFSSEHDRDVAIEALGAPLPALYKRHYAIRAEKKFYEPQAVVWENFAISSAQVAQRMFFGVVGTLVAIVLWGVCFYAPYAYFEADTYVATGDSPSFTSELTFSMLVVVGNQLMYFLCSTISESVGFRSRDHVQKAYVLLYTGAVLVNTVVDLTIVIYTTYLSMVARGVRTDDGTLLSEVPTRTGVFESYPMMKIFGRTLYEYNFPSCFLIPFMAEAIFTVVLPYHLGYRLVRTRPVNRATAEACLAPIPMDLARYGDLLVNVILATISFFTASGWVLRTFLGLLASNIFVYAFDHYRVLRQAEHFYLASGDVDAAVQYLLCIPCAVLAAAVAYQAHSLAQASSNLWLLLTAVFCGHVVIHTLVLRWAVRRYGPTNHTALATPYQEVAAEWPGNWFTSNPVHCLRSLHLHCHSPPCIYYLRGKEEYIEPDEAKGQYYNPAKRKSSIVAYG